LRRTKDTGKLARVFERLAENVSDLGKWSILPFTELAIHRAAWLRILKLNVRKMDLSIAAITLEQGRILGTRNTRDLCRVAGFVMEDWSLPLP
jgi:tRNA(fMet)-specific endonuclease VapC